CPGAPAGQWGDQGGGNLCLSPPAGRQGDVLFYYPRHNGGKTAGRPGKAYGSRLLHFPGGHYWLSPLHKPPAGGRPPTGDSSHERGLAGQGKAGGRGKADPGEEEIL